MTSGTFIEKIAATAKHQGNKKAITFLRNGETETTLTYAQLIADIDQMASFLHDLGIQKGDRVILLVPKAIICVIAHFAILRLGAISVPLNPGFKETELAYLLKDTEAALIFTTPGKSSVVRNIDPTIKILEITDQKPYQNLDFFRSAPTAVHPEVDIAANDPALIIYTSGTTGNPKGAVLTQGNLRHDARNVSGVWEITTADVLCHALPLFHVHGLCFALHTLLLSGANLRMTDRFSPDIILKELSSTGRSACNLFMAVPAMYTKLINALGNASPPFDGVRLLTSGSAPLLEKDFEGIREKFGLEPVEREGMSETGMNFSNPLHGIRKPGSIGLPLPGVVVRIVAPDTRRDVKEGEIGELWLKSASITPGYWRKPAETEATFLDGWFRTGDLGKVDKDGYYYLTDRIKHIIITGGENVSAKEVETTINEIDGVRESSVVGIPDDQWGEKVAAAIAPETGAPLTAMQVKTFCRQRLHDWKCPKEVIFVDEIPKNAMGKTLKEAVKAFFQV